MIEKYFTTEFSVLRQVWSADTQTGDTIKSSTEQLVGTFLGHMQQADPEYVQSLGLTMTKPFTVWCACGTDVTDGDIISTEEDRYAVRGKMKNTNGRNKHIELIVEWYGVAVSPIAPPPPPPAP